MNSLKTLVTVVVLIAIVYAAYAVINRTPDDVGGPSGFDQDWNAPLSVNPGTSGGLAPSFPGSSVGSGSVGGGLAPPFTPGAPPLGTPPVTGGSDSMTPAGPATDAAAATSAVPPPPLGVMAAADSSMAPPLGPAPGSPAASDSPRVLAPPPSSPASAPPEVTATAATGAADDFAGFMQQVHDSLRGNRLAEAHLALSQRYLAEGIAPAHRRQMEQILDQLAGTVIYSREHLLEPAHRVAPTETLQQIANRYNVPTGLLAKINGLDPAAPLRPGQELKVVHGPFLAVVDLGRYELTLLLADGRYAGRFAIGVGPDLAAPEGTLMVTDKTDTSALGPAGINPVYGSRWIGLGERLGLHGTNSPQDIGHPMSQGCIALSRRDVEDLYDILSIGSRVVIRR